MNKNRKTLAWKSLLLACLWVAIANAQAVTEYRYKVIAQYPHSTKVFTQGLEFYDGQLLESAGKFGESSLSLRTLSSDKMLKSQRLPAAVFGEGITQLNGRIYQLTWQSGKVFVYDTESFEVVTTLAIKGEGWGLTNNGKELIMSNGSDQLHFMDPENLELRRSLAVSLQGKPVSALNELEWVEGKIYANVWRTDWIVIIDPSSGHITGMVNLKALKPKEAGVLNGIAYDSSQQRLYITGKYWPKLYQIELQQ